MNSLIVLLDFQSIWDFIVSFIDSPVGKIIAFSTGLIGIILAFYIYKKSKASIGPRYLTKSSQVINKNSISHNKDIKVLYKEEKVSSLTITKLAFWNAGNTWFKSDYAARRDPLRIEIGGDFEFLDFDVLYKNGANGVDLNYQQIEKDGVIIENKKIINISFDYFAPTHGFVVKLYHTANSGASVKVNGSLISGEKIERINDLKVYFGVTSFHSSKKKRKFRRSSTYRNNLLFNLLVMESVVYGLLAFIIILMVIEGALPFYMEIFLSVAFFLLLMRFLSNLYHLFTTKIPQKLLIYMYDD